MILPGTFNDLALIDTLLSDFTRTVTGSARSNFYDLVISELTVDRQFPSYRATCREGRSRASGGHRARFYTRSAALTCREACQLLHEIPADIQLQCVSMKLLKKILRYLQRSDG